VAPSAGRLYYPFSKYTNKRHSDHAPITLSCPDHADGQPIKPQHWSGDRVQNF